MVVVESTQPPETTWQSGRFSGYTGCYRASGAYTLDGGTLVHGALVTTRRTCHDGMALERELTQALAAVGRWQVRDGQLP